MNIFRSKICVLIATILVGCGGGSNSSQPAGTQTTFNVSNKTDVAYSSAAIMDDDGGVIYANEFSCPASANSCALYLPYALNKPVNLVFKDASGRMLSAYHSNPQGRTYLDVVPTALSTGMYLMERLSSEYLTADRIDWEDLNVRTSVFFTNFDSPDGFPNDFEEVGQYYSKQMGLNPELTENNFLANFRLRLLNWDVAQASELPNNNVASISVLKQFYAWASGFNKDRNFSLITNAYAAEASCSDGLSTFLSFANNIGGLLPIVGDAIAGTAGIAGDYCDGTDSKLDAILAKLETLQSSIDAVGKRLGELTEFLSDSAANEQTTKFQNLAEKTRDYKSTYKTFLLKYKVATLKDYFEAKGGWNQGLAEGGETLKSILYAPYKSPVETGMIGMALATTNTANFNTYLKALNLRCKSLSQSDSNFIAVRQNCNNIIASNTAMLVGSQGGMLPIIKDVYEVLEKYKNVVQTTGATVMNDYPVYAGLTSYSIGDVKTLFKKQQADVLTKYKSTIPGETGYFEAFDGLDAGLLKNMVSRQCNQAGSSSDNRDKNAAIVGWYSPKADAKQNYIVTNCRGDNSEIVKARYYYLDQGNANQNDVSNVLGVLLASEYATGGSWMYNNSSSSYTYAVYVPAYAKFSAPQVTGVNAAQDRKSRSTYVVKSAGGGSNSSPKGELSPYNGTYDGGKYSTNVFDGVLTVYNYNWVSFKDSAGFNYVIYVPLGGRYGSDYGYGYMYCMSSDCKVNSGSKTLSFKNGPQSVNFFESASKPFDFQLKLD